MIPSKTEAFLRILLMMLSRRDLTFIVRFQNCSDVHLSQVVQDIPSMNIANEDYDVCGLSIIDIVCNLDSTSTSHFWKDIAAYDVEFCRPELFSLVTIGKCFRTFSSLPELLYSPFAYLCYDPSNETTIHLHVDSDFQGEQKAFQPIPLEAIPSNLTMYMFYNQTHHDSPMRYYLQGDTFGHIPKYNVNYPLINGIYTYYMTNGETMTSAQTYQPYATPIGMYNVVGILLKPQLDYSSLQMLPFPGIPFTVYILLVLLVCRLLIFSFDLRQKCHSIHMKDVFFSLITCIVHPSSLPAQIHFRYFSGKVLLCAWYLVCLVIATTYRGVLVASLNAPPINLTTSVLNSGWQFDLLKAKGIRPFLKSLTAGGYWVSSQMNAEFLLAIWQLRNKVYFVYDVKPDAFDYYMHSCVHNDTNYGCRCTRIFGRWIYESGVHGYSVHVKALKFASKWSLWSGDVHSTTIDKIQDESVNSNAITFYLATALLGHTVALVVLIMEILFVKIIKQTMEKCSLFRNHLQKSFTFFYDGNDDDDELEINEWSN